MRQGFFCFFVLLLLSFVKTMENSAVGKFIQSNLHSGHTCLAFMSCRLIEDWCKEDRLLALVYQEDLASVFVYSSRRVPVLSAQDLTIDKILPVNSKFQYRSESNNDLLVDTDLTFILSIGEQQSRFSTPCSAQAESFLAHLQTAVEAARARSSADFSWVNTYLPPSARLSCVLDNPFVDDTFKAPTCPVESAEEAVESNSLQDSEVFKRDLPTRVAVPMVMTGRQSTFQDNLAKQQHTIALVMAEREAEYAQYRRVKLFSGTFNTNGKSPPKDLGAWLVDSTEPAPDIYALGFQELDLSQGALLLNRDSQKEQEWQRVVSYSLHPAAVYDQIRLERLVGVMLLVFVRSELVQHVTEVASSYVATGLMNVMGNKGGVAVRMRLFNTSLCFVNSHLAAHQEEIQRRNQDYHEILKRMDLGQEMYRIDDHDLVFWMGDLNYRIDLPYGTVMKLLEGSNFNQLLLSDQLTAQKHKRKSFEDFVEGDITFPPSYKYDVGTSNFDSSEKHRTPAWTDRIQWRSRRRGEGVTQNSYTSHMDVACSDHKPVSATYVVEVKDINEARRRVVYQDVLQKVDRLENDYLPHARLSTQEVDFGQVKFMQHLRRTIEIQNNGKGALEFEFKQQRGDDMRGMCKPWLNVKPTRGMLFKDQSTQIELEIYVQAELASAFSSGEQLDDILVLHLINGKDFFIMIRGEYVLSSFGLSLNTLYHLPQFVRDVPSSQLLAMEKGHLLEESKALPQPKEIYRLIDHIVKHGLDHSQLFQVPGISEDMEIIRETLDVGSPNSFTCHINSVAEALLVFLQALRQPVVPVDQVQRALDVAADYSLCQQVIKSAPELHRKLFNYLIRFLRHVLRPEHSQKNGLTAVWLAATFGDVILRQPGSPLQSSSHGVEKKARGNRKQTFLLHFLVENYDADF